MQMELNQEERRMLDQALGHYLSELTGEIGQTDNADFRQELKREREVLALLRARMEKNPESLLS